jgi:hypothetical protein
MTHTIEVLQEDIDNAVIAIAKDKFAICTSCIITQALNRTFKGEVFETAFTYSESDKRKLELSTEARRIIFMHSTRDWKNVKPFTFTATEY